MTYAASGGVKRCASVWSRQVSVATSTADVVGIFQLKMTVRQQTATTHANHWTATTRLQVGNTGKQQHISWKLTTALTRTLSQHQQ